MGKEVRENRRTFCCAALYVQISNCLPKNVQSSIHFVCSKAKGSTNNCECVMYGWPLAKWPETLFITASRPLAIPAAVLHTVQICTRNGGLGFVLFSKGVGFGDIHATFNSVFLASACNISPTYSALPKDKLRQKST